LRAAQIGETTSDGGPQIGPWEARWISEDGPRRGRDRDRGDRRREGRVRSWLRRDRRRCRPDQPLGFDRWYAREGPRFVPGSGRHPESGRWL